MLQSAYAQKPVGPNLNFAIANVWGQGEEGPPGCSFQIPYSLERQAKDDELVLRHKNATSALTPASIYHGAKSRNRLQILHAIGMKRNLPCNRKPLQQCRSTILKSIFESPMIHAQGISKQLIANKKCGF